MALSVISGNPQHDAPSPSTSVIPGVSIVISSRNRPALLRDTVLSILEADEIPAELVIVDQSDRPDALVERIQAPGGCEMRYRWSRSVGASRGRNAGVAAASHDVLVFTDDDVRVTRGWLGSLVRALVNAEPAVIVTGRVLVDDEDMALYFAGASQSGDAVATYRGRVGIDVLASGNMAIRRQAIVSVGGFDERLGPGTLFPAAEDSDLGFRLLEAGYTIVYTPDAVLYHRAWRPIADFFRLRWAYGRGKGAYYAKHLSLRRPDMVRRMIGQVLRRLWRVVRWLWRQPRRATGELIFVVGLLAGFSQWLLTRRSAR